MNVHEQQAYDLGVEHAKNAASWVIDGNTPHDSITRLLARVEDGDPQADDFLPRRPNLSGEYADDPTPARLALEILGDGPGTEARAEQVDALCDAYEEGVTDTFMHECERRLREAIA